MTTFSGKVTGVIYEYAPENMMSAADFEALLKAEKELAETKRQLAEIEHAYVDKDKQLQGARAECASAVNRAECNRRELEAARDECAKLQADNDWLRKFGAAACAVLESFHAGTGPRAHALRRGVVAP